MQGFYFWHPPPLSGKIERTTNMQLKIMTLNFLMNELIYDGKWIFFTYWQANFNVWLFWILIKFDMTYMHSFFKVQNIALSRINNFLKSLYSWITWGHNTWFVLHKNPVSIGRSTRLCCRMYRSAHLMFWYFSADLQFFFKSRQIHFIKHIEEAIVYFKVLK